MSPKAVLWTWFLTSNGMFWVWLLFERAKGDIGRFFCCAVVGLAATLVVDQMRGEH